MHFNYLEMKYLVFCVTLNLLFFANIVSSEVNIVANYDDVATSTKKFDIKQALQISCNVTVTEEDLDENAKLEVKWEKDGKSLPDKDSIQRRISLSHNGNVHKLQLNAGEQEDAGNYSCVAYINNIEQKRAFITVESKIHVKIPRDITVIEGEKLRVVCLVHGNPIPQIVWLYRNETYEESRGRVKLEEDPEKKVPNAVFIIDEITVDDQQKELTCKGISKNTNESSNPSMGLIRVKDKYAALWPFIGICLEVLVLCAVILIYEKKRNKQELEESDTDQSPEQHLHHHPSLHHNPCLRLHIHPYSYFHHRPGSPSSPRTRSHSSPRPHSHFSLRPRSHSSTRPRSRSHSRLGAPHTRNTKLYLKNTPDHGGKETNLRHRQ